MNFRNDHTGDEFIGFRESLDIAMEEYPDFTRKEKRHIASLIQRKSFLQSQDLNIARQKELAALRWVLREINDFTGDEVEDEE